MNIHKDLLAAAMEGAARTAVGRKHEIAIIEAYSMACSMLEGLLDPDPVIRETAYLLYVKRLDSERKQS